MEYIKMHKFMPIPYSSSAIGLATTNCGLCQ